MKRECSFEKQFYAHMEFVCEKEKTDFCQVRSCDCACSQIAKMIAECCKSYFDHRDHYFLTIFQQADVVKIGTLSDFNVADAKARMLRKLRRLKISGFKFVGSLEIQLQDYIADDRTRTSRWLVHWHLLCLADVPLVTLKTLIYQKFNMGKTHRDALVKPVIHRPFDCTYLIKPSDNFKKKLASSEFGQMNVPYRIKGKPRRELYALLQQTNRLDWLIFLGFRRYGNRIALL